MNKTWMTSFIPAWLRLIQLQRRYPGRTIQSQFISQGVKLGARVKVKRGVELSSRVSIGDYSYIQNGTMIESGSIGRFCSIGPFCQIGLAQHPLHFLSTSPQLYGKSNIFSKPSTWDAYTTPPVIEDDVWIGGNAIILQGIRIGCGAIIAAGAVVTKDVDPYTIVGGIPARKIRDRFDQELRTYLLSVRWWELPTDKLARLQPLFTQELDLSTLQQALSEIRSS